MENFQDGYKAFPYLSSSFESGNRQIEIPSLKSISATYIASKIWENPILKNQLRDLFLSHQKVFPGMKISSTMYRMFNGFLDKKEFYPIKISFEKYLQMTTNSAEEILNTLELPVKLFDYCKDVSKEMNDKIIDWIIYVIEVLKFDFKFCEKIYWTPNGTIDENKIFQSWANDEEFATQKTSKAPAAYLLACINVQEDFIVQHQSDMEKFIRTHEPEFYLSNYDDKVYTLMASYLYFLMENNFIPMKTSNTFHCIASPKYMAKNCAKSGLIKAAFYFWQCCISNENDLGVNARQLVEACLSAFGFPSESRYKLGNEVKFFMFLISVMTDEQKNDLFINKGEAIFEKIVDHHPLHVIILELVENYYPQYSLSDWQSAFESVLCLKEENNMLRFNSNVNELYQLFLKLIMKVPNDLKEKVIDFVLISEMLGSDLTCLKLVMSNMDENTRSEVIKGVLPVILLLIKEGKIKQLDEFMNEILISENERKFFKDYILSRISEILKEIKTEDAEKLFDCLSLTEVEKATIRYNVCCFKMFQDLIITLWETCRRFVNRCLNIWGE